MSSQPSATTVQVNATHFRWPLRPVVAQRAALERVVPDQSFLRPRVALLGAVAEPDGPFGAMAHVIGHLLDRLCGDRGKRRITALR